jgi:hypothetical protein
VQRRDHDDRENEDDASKSGGHDKDDTTLEKPEQTERSHTGETEQTGKLPQLGRQVDTRVGSDHPLHTNAPR